ncbi:hypothetical protein VTK73DRAFT_660 [Phialemonium thermophilum]|uniref:Aminoglycoside phosphotransferase domain-containing protein n=1 Tax=Phialemonium thermophilum TaxID=223376 RepID=A0ABR3VUN6_9PEZI
MVLEMEPEADAITGFVIRPRLDHRGFPLATDDQRRQANRDWIDRLDPDAICALAAQHYGDGGSRGAPCCRVVDKRNGSFNACFFVELDGVGEARPSSTAAKWVVRIPIATATEDDPWPRLQSEVATMRFLQQHTRIPIPRIHAFGRGARLRKPGASPTADETTAAAEPPPDTQSFLIMDFVEGEPLNTFRLETLDQASRRAFFSQLLDMLADLRALEFPLAGSLLLEEADAGGRRGDVPALGPVQFLPSTPLCLPRPPPPPFSSARAYMRYRFRMLSAHYQEPYRDHDVDDVRRELFALYHLRAAFDQVAASSAGPHGGPFILDHADLHPANILVDSAWRIRGVLDWECAATVPRCVFAPPSFATGHDARVSGLQRARQRAIHADFQAVLAEKAKAGTIYATLQDEWYGAAASVGHPELAAADRLFCIARCLRRPSEAAASFYEFLAPESMRPRLSDGKEDHEEKELWRLRLREQLKGFFDEHTDLAAEAQRRADQCARYTAFLKENGLYETERDRVWAQIQAIKSKFPLLK